MLEYFEDPATAKFQISERCICCDVCERDRIIETTCVGISLKISLTNYYELQTQNKPKRRHEIHNGKPQFNTSKRHKTLAEESIRAWRTRMWADVNTFPMSRYGPLDALIDDIWIDRIASRAMRITIPEDIPLFFGKDCGWEASLLKDHVQGLVDMLVSLQKQITEDLENVNPAKTTKYPSAGLTEGIVDPWLYAHDPVLMQRRQQR
ncbi:hypothetical protein BGX38DRAFT_686852 [Terfezia claveryi]|nr:hypothetical protein BGX38DRAFT_686852 [Terfezia claveryi]